MKGKIHLKRTRYSIKDGNSSEEGVEVEENNSSEEKH